MKESTALDCVKLFWSDLFRRLELQLLQSPKEVPRSGVGRCESGVFPPSGVWATSEANPRTRHRIVLAVLVVRRGTPRVTVSPAVTR